jgi:hypothetical protein
MSNFDSFAKELDQFKIADNLVIIGIAQHKFFDGYTVNSNASERLYYLYQGKEPIAIFQLKHLGFDKGVEIGFIQGFKGVRPRDHWLELLLTPIIYFGLKHFPKLKNNAISLNMEQLKKYENKSNWGEELKTNPLIKSELGIYGKVRDLFFDKFGKLNFGKQRVKSLVFRLQQEQELQTHFKKQLRRKPVEKLSDLFKRVKRRIFYK